MTFAFFFAFCFFNDCAEHCHHTLVIVITFFVILRPFTLFGLIPFRVLTFVRVVVLVDPLWGAIALAVCAELFRLFTPPDR